MPRGGLDSPHRDLMQLLSRAAQLLQHLSAAVAILARPTSRPVLVVAVAAQVLAQAGQRPPPPQPPCQCRLPGPPLKVRLCTWQTGTRRRFR